MLIKRLHVANFEWQQREQINFDVFRPTILRSGSQLPGRRSTHLLSTWEPGNGKRATGTGCPSRRMALEMNLYVWLSMAIQMCVCEMPKQSTYLNP